MLRMKDTRVCCVSAVIPQHKVVGTACLSGDHGEVKGKSVTLFTLPSPREVWNDSWGCMVPS